MLPTFSSLFQEMRRYTVKYWISTDIFCVKIDNFKWKSFQMEVTGISTSLFRTVLSNVKGDHRKKRRSRSMQPACHRLLHPRGQEGGPSMKPENNSWKGVEGNNNIWIFDFFGNVVKAGDVPNELELLFVLEQMSLKSSDFPTSLCLSKFFVQNRNPLSMVPVHMRG